MMSSIEIKNNRAKSKKIVKKLIDRYGKEIPVYLNYHKNKKYEFLFAVMMSAQTTDIRVNEVTKVLYKKYKKLSDFANANLKEFEKDIKPVGFYHQKAISVINTARDLIDKFKGEVPNNFDDLVKLRGVGNKTAAVVLGHIWDIPAMAVDTHVNRISNKLFTLNEKNPDVVCEMLKQIVEKKYWVLWNTHIIALGREICLARSPKCSICFLKNLCNFYNI